jgi:transaldolase
MKENPLLKLRSCGQEIWLDFLSRGMLASGQLQRLVELDGVGGVTSNPAIFAEAMTTGHDYDDAIRDLARAGKQPAEIYEVLAVEDIRRAADVLRPTYDRTAGKSGYVSLEVSPYLARRTADTLAEARRLWGEVDRPNVFIKIPGTQEGLSAIRQAIAEGINVNVTLLFGLPRYAEVIDAYLAGLEARAAQRKPLAGVTSVASFFLSRIDVLIDPLLEPIVHGGGPQAELAGSLCGQIAIASAKAAYANYQEIFAGPRFRKLAEREAAPQRLLWASTGTKNPAFSDVKYVEALIGPHTINTVPLKTLEAYRDHGNPAARLKDNLAHAEDDLRRLDQLQIDLNQVTARLEEEGIEKFREPFDHLLDVLRKAAAAALTPTAVGR